MALAPVVFFSAVLHAGEKGKAEPAPRADISDAPPVIDTHVHLLRPFDSQGRRQGYSPNQSSAEEYVSLMAQAGIDRAFYISWSPEDIPSDLTRKKIKAEDVREVMTRDYAIEVLRKYPDRFYWFPCHLGPQVSNHMQMAREHLELGAAGFKVVPSFWGELPDDPRLMRIYALARDYGAQIMIDTSFWYLGKGVNWLEPDQLPEGHREVAKRVADLDDYLAHLRIAVRSFPTVNFLLAHAGAVDFTPENMRTIGSFIREHANVFADLGALSTASPSLDVLVKTAGDDRVSFGTDWPHFAQGEKMTALLDAIRRPGRFTTAQLEGLLGQNALKFLKGRRPGLRALRPDAGPPAGQLLEVEELHRSSIVIMGHDHLIDRPRLLSMPAAGLTAKVLHVSLDVDAWHGPEAREQSLHRYTGWTVPALQAIERVREIIESEPNRLCLALTAADISRAHGQGKSAIVLGFEGGKPVEQSLDLLRTFHRLGVRVLQLTWAGGNDICDRRDPPKSEGLTPFGVELVREMNRLGMLIDPGHCSRKTFFDVIERSTRPVAVLHTTPAGTKGSGDLDDEQVRAIARKGGVIGLHFFSHYLNPSRKATVEDLVEHVDYIRRLVGIDYVALGGDYLELTESFIKGHGPVAGGYLGIPEELDSYEKVVNVTRALRLHGYADEEIRKVLGGNLMRVFQQAFTPDEGLEP